MAVKDIASNRTLFIVYSRRLGKNILMSGQTIDKV
ncbi:hypothetical protein ABIA52_003179 [Paenarthrobacter histidinolovorans]|uniref:Uncharacterized protein n=1 Tax=Paenarthrobacter histidinolovorans TaxID=43664 RepID=A0ABW8N9M3_9MICC